MTTLFPSQRRRAVNLLQSSLTREEHVECIMRSAGTYKAVHQKYLLVDIVALPLLPVLAITLGLPSGAAV
jgi:hypothetical protein